MEISWLSTLPPILTIFIALLSRKVILSLVCGIGSGILIYLLLGYNTGDHLQQALLKNIFTLDNSLLLLFPPAISIMSQAMIMNGGINGIIQRLSRIIDSPQKAQFATWLLGFFIFFDDYANTLIVGNTLRPITDRYKVSREKLAYLVDSTAAPIASIAIITTWVGYEVLQVKESMAAFDTNETAFTSLLSSIKYAYYPILTLFFIYLLIRLNSDFGPMYHAESRARKRSNDDHSTQLQEGKALYAFIPISVMIGSTIFFLFLSQLLTGGIQPFWSIAAGSLLGMGLALILTTSNQRWNAVKKGVSSMFEAVLILLLALTLGQIINLLHTKDFILLLIPTDIPIYIFPVALFILAAVMSFTTGSSFGTMSVIFPSLLPTVWSIMQQQPLSSGAVDYAIYHGSISVILAGAIFGDHCSPISDTTILSSAATRCEHTRHVKTQLPYALVVGLISTCMLYIVFALDLHWSIGYIVGALLCFLIIRLAGKKVV